MNFSEFGLIEHFFSQNGAERRDVVLGIGDDAALLRAEPGKQVITAIATVRDPDQIMSPEFLGEQAMRQCLERLRSAGASPAWATLALTIPEADEEWLTDFSRCLASLMKSAQVALVGGDTTRGPLSVTVTVNGFV